MIHPPYFKNSNQPTYVYHVKKFLYGLRQASCVWNRCFTTFLAKHHFVATPQDLCLYKTTTAPVILLTIFVDNGLIASSNCTDFNPILTEMDNVFKIRIDKPDTFVGLRITRNHSLCSIFFNQTCYVERLLNKYGYTNAHPTQVLANPNVRLSLQAFPTRIFQGTRLLLRWGLDMTLCLTSTTPPGFLTNPQLLISQL